MLANCPAADARRKSEFSSPSAGWLVLSRWRAENHGRQTIGLGESYVEPVIVALAEPPSIVTRLKRRISILFAAPAALSR
jgi:hypothetical protein